MELNVILVLNPYKNFNANKWVNKKMNTFPIRCFDFWVQKTWQTDLRSSIPTCDKPAQLSCALSTIPLIYRALSLFICPSICHIILGLPGFASFYTQRKNCLFSAPVAARRSGESPPRPSGTTSNKLPSKNCVLVMQTELQDKLPPRASNHIAAPYTLPVSKP